MSSSWTGDASSIPEKENFQISWRPEAERIIILFSDEEPQSFLRPRVTNDIVIEALRAAINTKFYAFVDRGWDGDRWDDIILAGRGSRFTLTSNAVEMYNDLMSIIDEACLPRDDQALNSDLARYKLASYFYFKGFYDYERGMCLQRK